GVMLPAPASFNCSPPPDAGCPVEIEKYVATSPTGMFQHEMAIEQDGLNLGKKRIVAVDMRPASLDHSYVCAGEMMNRALKEIRRWNEIGIENCDVLSRGRLHSLMQRARLVSRTIGAMVVRDRISLRAVMLY